MLPAVAEVAALPTRCVPLDIRENRVRLVVITHNDFL
jgi:hypothetical protein